MSHRFHRAVPLLAVAALLVTTACEASDDTTEQRQGTADPVELPPGVPAPEGSLDWEACEDDADDVRCAVLEVPVSHDAPDGATVELSLAQLPVQDAEQRRGTLVFHGGGPAASTPFLLDPEQRAGFEGLTESFDVVTFDSRGYGGSEPLCDPDAAPPIPPRVDTEEDWDAQRAAVAEYGNSCVDQNPDLAGAADAEAAAHDIDLIREALGEERIAYFGNSYGTVFGQEYAAHYGDRLSRLYLDSVFDHTVPYEERMAANARQTESQLESAAEVCAEDPGCALHGGDPLAAWDGVVESAEDAPIDTGDGRELDGEDLRHATLMALSGAPETLWDAVSAAQDGDGSGFAQLLPPEGPPPPAADAGQLTYCLDFPVEPDDWQGQEQLAADLRESSPRIGWLDVGREFWRCPGWPVEATNPPGPLSAEGAPPALVVNSAVDSMTHIEGAGNVSEALPGSELLAYSESGHAVYLTAGSACVEEHVHDYLRDGTLPEEGAACGA